MKLSFSTFGWSGYTWQDFCGIAKDGGFGGIEIYNINEPKFSGRSGIFDPAMARAAHRALVEQNLTIPCIDTSCNIGSPEILEECCAEIESYIANAASLTFPM